MKDHKCGVCGTPVPSNGERDLLKRFKAAVEAKWFIVKPAGHLPWVILCPACKKEGA